MILRGLPDEAVSAAPTKPRSEGKRAEEAVKWFQKALWIVEKLDDADTPGVKDLKVVLDVSSRVNVPDFCCTIQRAVLRGLGERPINPF